MKHWICMVTLALSSLAMGAAIEISEADLLSGDIRKSPVQVCKFATADVYADTLTATKDVIKEKGNVNVKVYYATAVAVQYSYANTSATYAELLDVYKKALTDMNVSFEDRPAQSYSMLIVNTWCTKIKDVTRMEAAIKAGEGVQQMAFERAQLMRLLGYPVEELEKAYLACGRARAHIQSALMDVYIEKGLSDKAANAFFQMALGGNLASNTALKMFDRAYPMILVSMADNAVLVKKLEMIVRIYTVKYRQWESQNPGKEATDNPWHMFINSVQDQINGLSGK